MAETAPSQRIDAATALALVALAVGVFVIANDFTAMSVALTSIERDLDSELSTIQWVVNAYALVFGVLIVTGGRLADMFGRRRLFFAGAAIFAAFSVLGGLAQSSGWLIACRAVMGVGGAMMWPAVLGMTYAALPENRAGLAGALIIGSAGFGNAAGPLVGGFLTDALSWRWILFVNLPIAALAGVVIWRTVHQREAASRERIDYAGVIALSLGLVALLLALDESEEYGWGDWRILGLLAASAVLLAAFVPVERRAGARALVPRDVLANRDFASACLSVLLLSAVFFASVLYLPQFMQKLLGYSPLEAGAGLLPMLATFAAVSFASGPLYERLGPKAVVSAGAGCLAAGMLAVSLVGPRSGYQALIPGMVVLGVGVGLFYSSVTTAAVTSLDPSRTSLAGGIVYMFQVAGGSVGVGLTTAVFAAASRDGLADGIGRLGLTVTEAQRDAVSDILAGTESARQALAQFGPDVAARVELLVREAFVAGLDTAFRVDAALAVGGFLVALALVGGRLGASSR